MDIDMANRIRTEVRTEFDIESKPHKTVGIDGKIGDLASLKINFEKQIENDLIEWNACTENPHLSEKEINAIYEETKGSIHAGYNAMVVSGDDLRKVRISEALTEYESTIATSKKYYEDSVQHAQKVLEETIEIAKKTYGETIAPAKKAYDDIDKQASEKYQKQINGADKEYSEIQSSAKILLKKARAELKKPMYDAVKSLGLRGKQPN